MTHRPGTSSLGPNLHALCPLQASGKDPSNVPGSLGLDSHLPWDGLRPGQSSPGGREGDSQQQLQEMNESISL